MIASRLTNHVQRRIANYDTIRMKNRGNTLACLADRDHPVFKEPLGGRFPPGGRHDPILTSPLGYSDGQISDPAIDVLALALGIAKPLLSKIDITGISSFKAAPGAVIQIMGCGFRQHGSAAAAFRFPAPVTQIAF